jgi:pimeloyl-ACP methyl ester carboxylesterase
MSLKRALPVLGLVVLCAGDLAAQLEPPPEPPPDWGPTSIDHLNVDYPYPVQFLDVEVYGQDLRLGILREAGFRTIAIDRLGFGRSSKPEIHYNFHIPARNTKRLLDALGIERAAIVGHSMGGMVASRFAMTYPDRTSHVAFVNQIGLSDQRPGREWSEPGDGGGARPSPQQYYQQVVRSHQRYYVQGWRPEYLEWARASYGVLFSGEFDRWQRVRGLLGQAIFEDPVVYDWQHIPSKALVIGGANDPLSRDFAADARRVAESLQNADLVLYPNVGHNPQFENSDEFHADLIRFLESDPDEPADQAWRQSDWGR